MESIQVGQLKTDFSTILQNIQNSGQKYIIEYGKKHKKVAMIIPYDKCLEETTERTFGLLENKGSFTIQNHFSMTDEELLGL
ncbi:MAG: Prevent-host-death family protein [uncultured Sulfurovum sp.]|uniref:Prevent-host-death family protein n=1 Tax=uncultured Sulfurovum sp. TaxID=269237 RepID=A0A6S6SQD5_9BACT|nr:MAG: Prevent-host-death family protein [uncultured Sulfurovum sp.]